MEIRLANIDDTAEIVKVLQLSLGEIRLPKTKEIWDYKHYRNPFGESLIIVAVVGGRIIGVRAFMKWKWKLREKTYSVMRAVDTGILPEFQRKGIFQALNFEALRHCDKFDFIFNTPNSKSLGGNMKMGWEHIGRVKVNFTLSKMLSFSGQNKSSLHFHEINCDSIADSLLERRERVLSAKEKLFTPKSSTFLKWRYEQNPLQKYQVFYDEDFFMAAYLKSHPSITELRIAESIVFNEAGRQKILSVTKNLNNTWRAPVITCDGTIKISPMTFSVNKGPVLIGRNLNLSQDQWNSFTNLGKWNYSLGDLELF